MIRPSRPVALTAGILTVACLAGTSTATAQFVVPGTGVKIAQVGDDFEDEDWDYTPNWPKASSNIDKQARRPGGVSTNSRWYESAYRGQPDQIQRVPTPPGGLPGSKGAMLLRTLNTGVPGRNSYKMQQDDLLLNMQSTIGALPVSYSPSIVARVYLHEFDKWENRTGASLGFRADCHTTITKPGRRGFLFRRASTRTVEPYWPGMFIQFNSKDNGAPRDSAVLLIRCDDMGRDMMGPEMQPGWWTLGMSFSPDGRVHYFARSGVDRLTAADHLASTRPYGYRTEQFATAFFNVVNSDNGRTWSTEWIIDDVEVYRAR